MTNCFLKWTVMRCGFCNLFLIFEQILERFLVSSQTFTFVSFYHVSWHQKKKTLKILSEFMTFTVFQNTATAVNYYISNKQICPERLLSAECI